MTVTLIGMPGVGKSCMGKVLARRMKLKLIDGDKLIEQNTGRELHEIISTDGLDAFKKIEEDTLLSISGDGLVISPGGSAVYYEAAMEHFKSLGPVVYLYASPEVLTERLGDFSKRGIVLADGMTLTDLYLERAPLYEKYAYIIIDCNGEEYKKYQNRLVTSLFAYKKYKER